jgi:hypothetical protein
MMDELIFVVILLVLIGFGNFLIRDLIYDANNWQWHIFWEEMIHGWMAGALFYFLFFTLNKWIINQYEREINKNHSSRVIINSIVASDSFETDPEQIIYIKAEGNYVIFYIEGQDGPIEKMIRQTLDNVEAQLAQRPDFIRTHRTYMVNRKFIKHSTGNAGGYQLSVFHHHQTIPVSRSKVKKHPEITTHF